MGTGGGSQRAALVPALLHVKLEPVMVKWVREAIYSWSVLEREKKKCGTPSFRIAPPHYLIAVPVASCPRALKAHSNLDGKSLPQIPLRVTSSHD